MLSAISSNWRFAMMNYSFHSTIHKFSFKYLHTLVPFSWRLKKYIKIMFQKSWKSKSTSLKFMSSKMKKLAFQTRNSSRKVKIPKLMVRKTLLMLLMLLMLPVLPIFASSSIETPTQQYLIMFYPVSLFEFDFVLVWCAFILLIVVNHPRMHASVKRETHNNDSVFVRVLSRM